MLVKTCLLNLKLSSDVADNEVAKNTKFNTLKTKVNGLGKKCINSWKSIQHRWTKLRKKNEDLDKKNTRYKRFSD